MRGSRGWFAVLSAVALALLGAVLVVSTAVEAQGRWKARDGVVVPGVVVHRERGVKAWVPTVTVAYRVGDRELERDVRAHLDVDEVVQVQVLPADPRVSRVVGEGGPALLVDGLAGLALVGLGPREVRRALRRRDG